MSPPIQDMSQAYLRHASAAEDSRNIQNQKNLDTVDSGLLLLANTVSCVSVQTLSEASKPAHVPNQVALSTKLKKAAPKNPCDKNRAAWTEEQIAKLIRLRVENLNDTVQGLCSKFNYTAAQLNSKLAALQKNYREDRQALEKYEGKEGLTKALLKQFKEMIQNKSHKWSVENVVKLIKLKVENPRKRIKKLVKEFDGRYDATQIHNQISRLNRECRNKSNYIKMCIQEGVLTEDLLKKFTQATSRKTSDERKADWTEEQIAKLIRLRVENLNDSVQELCSELNYTAKQLQNKIGALQKNYRENSQALEKYEGKEGLTKELLKQFKAMIPNKSGNKNRANWPIKNVVKLIKLKVENPNNPIKELVKEFDNQYDEAQINNQISRLNREYRNNSNYISKCMQEGGLTEDLLKKFIEETSKKTSDRKRTKWSVSNIAKFIKHQVDKHERVNQNQTSDFEGWDKQRLVSAKAKLYKRWRKNTQVLDKYIGHEGLTEKHIKTFKQLVLESRRFKRIPWTDKDTAKFIKHQVDKHERVNQNQTLDFEGWDKKWLVAKKAKLYKKWRNNVQDLDKYIGHEGLTEKHVTTFKQRVLENNHSKKILWTDKDTAKLIKLRAENIDRAHWELNSKFGDPYDRRQINTRLGSLYRKYREDNQALKKYVGIESLTEEHLKDFISMIPKPEDFEKKVKWSGEDTAKLIKLKAENPGRIAKTLVSVFEKRYTVTQINSRLHSLYMMHRKNKQSLEAFVGKEDLTSQLLENFSKAIPKLRTSWSDEDTAKLITLRANHPERPHLELVDELKGLYTGKQIDHRLQTLYRIHRRDNALRKYLGKAGLTEALLEKFIATIPKGKKLK